MAGEAGGGGGRRRRIPAAAVRRPSRLGRGRGVGTCTLLSSGKAGPGQSRGERAYMGSVLGGPNFMLVLCCPSQEC